MSQEKLSCLIALCAAGFAIANASPGLSRPQISISAAPSTQAANGGESRKASPLVCNINALDAKQRRRINELVNMLKAKIQEVKELSDGYALRLPADSELIGQAAEYTNLERLCCPFFEFSLKADRERGPVWIALRGRPGVKELAKIEFGIDQFSIKSSNEVAAYVGKDLPLVCNDAALEPAQYNRLVQLLKQIRQQKLSIKEYDDGFAVQMPASSSLITDIGEYMAIVRICSPYFETTMEVEAEGAPVWLRIGGRSGVKELAKSELRI